MDCLQKFIYIISEYFTQSFSPNYFYWSENKLTVAVRNNKLS